MAALAGRFGGATRSRAPETALGDDSKRNQAEKRPGPDSGRCLGHLQRLCSRHSQQTRVDLAVATDGCATHVVGARVQVTSPQRRKLAGERSAHGDDAELSAQWTRVRRQRGELWAEGSLLDRLADHVEELLLHFRPADLDGLVVLYSGAPGQHVASNWLRVKFGFSPSVPASKMTDEMCSRWDWPTDRASGTGGCYSQRRRRDARIDGIGRARGAQRGWTRRV